MSLLELSTLRRGFSLSLSLYPLKSTIHLPFPSLLLSSPSYLSPTIFFRLFFSPLFSHLDFLISYESTFGWVGSSLPVRITITNPNDPPGSPSVQKYQGHLAVIAKNSKTENVKEFIASFTPKDGSFFVTLQFEEAGVYQCMAQYEYNDLQQTLCRVQIGAAALIGSMFLENGKKS